MGVFRQLFGPSKAQIWSSLAAQIGGTYTDGGWWKGDRVDAKHGDWNLTLDTFTVSTGKSSVTYTRLRVAFLNPDSFRFTVKRAGFFSDIAAKLGLTDIEVGYPEFDRAFVVKANSAAKVKLLFADPVLRELLTAQPSLLLTVTDDEGFWRPTFPAGTDELRFMVVGVIKDQERLLRLFELFAETLDQLCRIGSARPGDPGVRL
jgi:hypothetical protein